MKRSFGDMDLLQQSNNVEKLLRGMIRQPAEKADSNFVDDVSMIKDLLKPGQDKKGQHFFQLRRFLNTFLQLAAEKKYSKNGAAGIFFSPSYFVTALVTI